MSSIDTSTLARLQQRPESVRNICILAHVDHGKTTLSDYLLATNGIVPKSQSGLVRYLDSRPDEQQRGITMKSSAISIYFPIKKSADAPVEEFLINLIDSPGHIDFSSEVSTASRLCDGAIVLVDAVEGVCSQTVTVLRQTWVEKLKPLLVINKMDRLITELQLTPSEAFLHLTRTVEQVNAVLGSFYQGERMEDDLNWRENMEKRAAATAAAAQEAAHAAHAGEDSVPAEFLEKDDEDIYFSPDNNNVIFCSAMDGWAFTVRQFVLLYQKKLGMNEKLLSKALWGNYYLDPKTRKVLSQKHLKGRNLKPIFVQFVLQNIWAVYEATVGIGGKGGNDSAMVEKIKKSLNITLPPQAAGWKDQKRVLSALFSGWLPLSRSLLVSVVEHIPPPNCAQPERMPALLQGSPGASAIDPKIKDAVVGFKTSKQDPVVVYVSKMISIPKKDLPENRRTVVMLDRQTVLAERTKRLEESVSSLADSLSHIRVEDKESEEPEEDENPERLIGFARIYSGVLSVGDEVYVLHPKFSPVHPHEKPEPKKVKITSLYMMMGQHLETLQSVPAGVVFGIGGLEGQILKSGTLCSQLEGAVNLAGVHMAGKPIFRVALTPTHVQDLDKMVKGLELLDKSDPCAEYEHLHTGEHVLATAGELHLERCLVDLKDRFARCTIMQGEPIVPYRETIVKVEEMKPPMNKELGRGVVVATTSTTNVSIRLSVCPLLPEVTDFLNNNTGSMRRLYLERMKDESSITSGNSKIELEVEDNGEGLLSPDVLKQQLQEKLSKSKNRDISRNAVDRIISFGPKKIGANMLVDSTKSQMFPKAFSESAANSGVSTPDTGGNINTLRPSDLVHRIIHSFQLMMQSGPLCQEPVQGVAVFIEDVTTDPPEDEEVDFRRVTSELHSTTQQAIKNGFLDWSPRMMLAMYSVEIQASLDVIGKVYDCIFTRRGRIVSEAMKEGTSFYTIQALLPVAESKNFSTAIREETSGGAQPQLVFAGFEILDVDPFWVPFTQDDLEDLGELADKDNVAKTYMDKVRKRKGLRIEGRTIDAEKQKTLKR